MLQAIPSFIPIQAGQSQFLTSMDPIINNLLGQVGYEIHEGYAIFTEDITKTLQVNNVMMQLVVMDLSKYTDFDILPIGADLEAAIIEEVFMLFAKQLPTDKVNDPGVDMAATVAPK